MSAPQISNLLSTRGGPRRHGNRGHDRPSPQDPTSSRHDVTIQNTDTDAAVSRHSAVQLGYLFDPYAKYFVTGALTRRLPIINRGTYTRTTALDMLVEAFLATRTDEIQVGRQIVSLGAGTDTRFFRMRDKGSLGRCLYHEIDFPSVCEAKRKIVEHSEELRGESIVSTVSSTSDDSVGTTGTWSLHSPQLGVDQYTCHAIDLRDLASSGSAVELPGLKTDVPTLVISECCLCYLSVEAAGSVLRYFTDRMPNVAVVLYEPVGTDDAFGQMMVENLSARGIVMPTVQRYKTLEDQCVRLRELGLHGHERRENVRAKSVDRIWEDWIEEREKGRVDALEGLDEVEEWMLLARHYVIVWGSKGDAKFVGDLLE